MDRIFREHGDGIQGLGAASTLVTEVRPATGNWVAALYRHRSWLWPVPGAVLALLVTAVLPADSTLDNLGEWAFKLSPFVLAVLAVALLPRGRFGPVLVVLGVIVYTTFVVLFGVAGLPDGRRARPRCSSWAWPRSWW